MGAELKDQILPFRSTLALLWSGHDGLFELLPVTGIAQ